jgi:hypothetical protein
MDLSGTGYVSPKTPGRDFPGSYNRLLTALRGCLPHLGPPPDSRRGLYREEVVNLHNGLIEQDLIKHAGWTFIETSPSAAE